VVVGGYGIVAGLSAEVGEAGVDDALREVVVEVG